MHAVHPLLAFAALLAGLAINSTQAKAETFNTCGNLVSSLPAVITTQGVYCLTHDLTTAMSSGNAIEILTNNVSIDCNGYKIGGLAAGSSSTASGIHADNTRQNITVRNCGVRGFYIGINLQGGAGHLVEDNRLDNNLYTGIYVAGDNNLVQRNRVYDTGGAFGENITYGIRAAADVIDNTVAGVFEYSTSYAFCYGIQMTGTSTEVRGNRVRGLVAEGILQPRGIGIEAPSITVDGNRISAAALTTGLGIDAWGPTDTICTDNTIAKFSTPMNGCQDGGGNVSN